MLNWLVRSFIDFENNLTSVELVIYYLLIIFINFLSYYEQIKEYEAKNRNEIYKNEKFESYELEKLVLNLIIININIIYK